MIMYEFYEDDCKEHPELYLYAQIMGIPIVKSLKSKSYLELLEKSDDQYYVEIKRLKAAIDKALDIGDKLQFEKLSRQYNHMLNES